MESNLELTIERGRALWDLQELDPPFMMLNVPGAPISTGAHDCEFWRDPDAFVAHHLPRIRRRCEITDDSVPVLRPPFSHASVPAALGARPELQAGKLWVRPALIDIREHRDLALPSSNDWLDHVAWYYRRLLELSEGHFVVGLTEIPGPADLMGALRGFERILFDLYDHPGEVESFARHATALGAAFDGRVRALLAEQEAFGGCWLSGTWAPANTICFCEHSSVNYSPQQYERFIRPANDSLLARYDRVFSYAYCRAGSHLLPHYFDRGRPVWIQSCDEDPSPVLARAHRAHAIVTIRATAAEMDRAVEEYGRTGVCYMVDCADDEEAHLLCRRFGRSVA